MNIPLSALLYQITDLCDYELFNTDPAGFYEGLLLSDDMGMVSQDNCLNYISDISLQNNCKRSGDLLKAHNNVFLCYCYMSPESIKNDYPNLHVIFLIAKDNHSFSIIFNRLLTIFHNFEYWDKTLHLSLLHGTTIQQLLDLTKPLLSHPMLILDGNLTVIGRVHVSHEIDPYMEDILNTGYISPTMLSAFRKQGVFPQTFYKDQLQISKYVLPNDNVCYSMCYQINIGASTRAYAIVFHCKSHPSNGYQYLMDMVIENLYLYFKQGQHLSSTGQYDHLLCTLISGTNLSEKQLDIQLSYIPELKSVGYFSLAQVRFNENKPAFSFISWNLSNTFSKFKPFVYKETLYILKIEQSSTEILGAFIPDSQVTAFKECFAGNTFTCIVSQPFFHLTDLNIASHQCDLAQQQSFYSNPDQLFIYYRDYKLQYMMQQLNDPLINQMIASPFYHILKYYDSKNNNNLCQILAEFLISGRNINLTAKKLFMHRNTVLNKVKKAFTLIGCECEDYADGFFFVINYLNDQH